MLNASDYETAGLPVPGRSGALCHRDIEETAKSGFTDIRRFPEIGVPPVIIHLDDFGESPFMEPPYDGS